MGTMAQEGVSWMREWEVTVHHSTATKLMVFPTNTDVSPWPQCYPSPLYQIFVCLFSLALIAGTSPQKSVSARKEQVPFSMAIGNGELMYECFPKRPRIGTAR